MPDRLAGSRTHKLIHFEANYRGFILVCECGYEASPIYPMGVDSRIAEREGKQTFAAHVRAANQNDRARMSKETAK